MPIGFERIKSISKAKSQNTYDLAVPDYNNFFLANSILTHNSGKTWLNMSKMSQLMTVKERFSNQYPEFLRSSVLLDAKSQPEFTKKKFHDPLKTPYLVERMKRYNKYFPFLQTKGIAPTTLYFNPYGHREIFKQQGVYDDYTIGLKASNLRTFDKQTATSILCNLTGIDVNSTSARMIRAGVETLRIPNSTFIDMLREINVRTEEELRVRKSPSITRYAFTQLSYALTYGDIGIGHKIKWDKVLRDKINVVLHLPTTSIRDSTLYQILFTVLMMEIFEWARKGKEYAIPNFYLEEAQLMLENKTSISAQMLKNIYELERISGRTIISVVRKPEYAEKLIWESDYVTTPQYGARYLAHLNGYTPNQGLAFDIEALQVRTGDANQFKLITKGQGELDFFPAPPLLQPF